jgi:hypothetical protein
MTCNQNCRQGRDCNCGGIHVIPVNDLREHVATGSCWCKPTPDPEEPFVMIHHSMDLREQFEISGGRLPS